jgi:ABC-type transporter Mla MlaB component
MTASTTLPDTCARLAIDGPMTVYEAPAQRHALLAALAAGAGLEIDVCGLDEIDTAGVQLLVLVQREGRDTGKPVRLAGQSAALAEVLGRYGIAAQFERAEDAGR